MADLNDAELNALAKTAGIDISPKLLTEVGYSLTRYSTPWIKSMFPISTASSRCRLFCRRLLKLGAKAEKERDINATGTDDCRRFARQF
jgi:hypothetical protein